MKNIKALGITLFFTILFLALASSQTLIAGKIYNSGFSDTISNADVVVSCNEGASLSTNSFDDGTYVVRFDESACKEGDSVSVRASKPGFVEKTGTGTVSKCEGVDCTDNYVMIINLGIKTQPPAQTGSSSSSSGGGSNRVVRYYLCGNGKCDSGENVNTCAVDCKKVEPVVQQNSTGDIVQLGAAKQESPEGLQLVEGNQTENGQGFGGITKAVIGTIGIAGMIIVIIFLVVVVTLAIAVRLVRSRNY